MRDPDFTLAGGPTTVYPGVLAALGQPVMHHCDPSFAECFRRTEAKVGRVFGTGNETILLPASPPWRFLPAWTRPPFAAMCGHGMT